MKSPDYYVVEQTSVVCGKLVISYSSYYRNPNGFISKFLPFMGYSHIQGNFYLKEDAYSYIRRMGEINNHSVGNIPFQRI